MNARTESTYRLRLHSGYFPGFVLPIFISSMASRVIVANLSASPRPQARLRRAVTATADMSTLISFLMSDSTNLSSIASSELLLLVSPHDRLENLHVPRTTTEISRETVANVCLARLRMFLEQTNGGHHHSRRANAALCPAAFDESLLHRVQLISRRDTFDRSNLCAFHLGHGHETTIHNLPIDHYRASAAFAFAATFFRSSQLQLPTQHIKQALHRIDFESLRLVINGKSYLYHPLHNSPVKCSRVTDNLYRSKTIHHRRFGTSKILSRSPSQFAA